MADDIVTRLIKTTCDLWYCPFSQMAIEAADEIEQLRKVIRQLESERDQRQRQAVNNG